MATSLRSSRHQPVSTACARQLHLFCQLFCLRLNDGSPLLCMHSVCSSSGGGAWLASPKCLWHTGSEGNWNYCIHSLFLWTATASFISCILGAFTAWGWVSVDFGCCGAERLVKGRSISTAQSASGEYPFTKYLVLASRAALKHAW